MIKPGEQTETPMIRYIGNEAHYSDIIAGSLSVTKQLWIGTADIKDLYISRNGTTVPYLKALSDLIRRKIEVRLIHAKEPGPNFRKDFDKNPELWNGLERVLCPRVHFKVMVFDMKTVYVGSANLTGAGLGMKGKDSRNFESGIFTNDRTIVQSVIQQFDDVWIGIHCRTCRRKAFCGDRIGG